MAMPDKIGGRDDEGERKPGLVIALGLRKPKSAPSHIGGAYDDEEEPEGSDEKISHEEALLDASDELIAECQRLKPSRDRVAAALKAAFLACDAMPHDEGEHTEEEGSE